MCSVCHTLSMIRTGAAGSGEQEASVREERWKSEIDGVWSSRAQQDSERPTGLRGRRHTGVHSLVAADGFLNGNPRGKTRKYYTKASSIFGSFVVQYSFTKKKTTASFSHPNQ